MARRRKDDDILDVLILLPWWVSVIVAALVYFGIRDWIPAAFAHHLVFGAVSQAFQPYAGFFAFIFLLAAPASLLRSAKRRKLLDQQTSLDSIRAMSWREFEMLCGEAYRRRGFAVEETGGGGADGGIDLILRRGGETRLVQCKRWKTYKVGVKDIITVYRRDRALDIGG